ncbi:hypothetical protein L873DRAFT_1671769 [Choiromyces venosus 120613-1]|uniref:F-box domain-containing protein n=1 Tax=Choiromyces venosus 120613-1 TaxID=1336337 RepID=A0A3N4JXA5_9PEZI|nr:hypothetical protein L873DRAFT_1671769 [Choiromyces venosus 120613-1]
MEYNEIESLFVPILAGSKDEYGKKKVLTKPLSFDRVNEGFPITSKTPLFQLPIELLNDITTYLGAKDLKSLALVDRNCRQLARSVQFCTVTLDYSFRKHSLITALHDEAQERSLNNGCLPQPSIGACVRRLVVATEPEHLSEAHSVAERPDLEDLREVWDRYFGVYTVQIASAIAGALPNLEELSLQDRTVAPEHLLGAIPASPIRTLKLGRIALAVDDPITVPSEGARWGVESLELEVIRDLNSPSSRCTANFCKSVLEATSKNLERLVWRGHYGDQQSFGQTISFPRLRTLSLSLISMPDDTVLSSFFPSDDTSVLRALSIDTRTKHVRNFLATLGQIKTLQSLHCHSFAIPKAPDISFIASNPQLKSLALSPHTNEYLTTTLLPALTGFTSLTSLSLIFESSFIDLSALSYISKIKSLTQLWLSAGTQSGWAVDWEIDHDTLLTTLSPLQGLRRIAFTRDTYRSKDGVPPIEYYYEYRILPAETPLPELGEDGLDAVWEEWHRDRMVEVARKYFGAFKRLKWLLVGKYPMGVMDGEVVVESGSRDGCEGVLRKWWGLDL